jgi:hypothetical protein
MKERERENQQRAYIDLLYRARPAISRTRWNSNSAESSSYDKYIDEIGEIGQDQDRRYSLTTTTVTGLRQSKTRQVLNSAFSGINVGPAPTSPLR